MSLEEQKKTIQICKYLKSCIFHASFTKNLLGSILYQNVGVNKKKKRFYLGIRKFNTREKGFPKIKAKGSLITASIFQPREVSYILQMKTYRRDVSKKKLDNLIWINVSIGALQIFQRFCSILVTGTQKTLYPPPRKVNYSGGVQGGHRSLY